MEKDADSLKPLVANYLDLLTDVMKDNADDLDELRRIYARVQKDRVVLSNIESKINEEISYLSSLNGKRAEIFDALAVATRERKA